VLRARHQQGRLGAWFGRLTGQVPVERELHFAVVAALYPTYS